MPNMTSRKRTRERYSSRGNGGSGGRCWRRNEVDCVILCDVGMSELLRS